MSVSGDRMHYATEDKAEVGFPSAHEPLLDEFSTSFCNEAPEEEVYSYVPYAVILAIITKHGGPWKPKKHFESSELVEEMIDDDLSVEYGEYPE